MTIYSGDEDCGDEITSPDCELVYADPEGSRGGLRMPAANDGPSIGPAGAHNPTAAAAPLRAGACPDCEGAGRVEVPVVRNDRRYTVIGVHVETCLSCLGSGREEGPNP